MPVYVLAQIALLVRPGNAHADGCPEGPRIGHVAADGVPVERQMFRPKRLQCSRGKPNPLVRLACVRLAYPTHSAVKGHTMYSMAKANSPFKLACLHRHPKYRPETVSCQGVSRVGSWAAGCVLGAGVTPAGEGRGVNAG